MKKIFNYEKIIAIRGLRPGKTLGVMAGTHGNEKCGVEAIKQIIPSLRVKRGVVYFIFGNPRAIERNMRFTEMNLNRAFLPAKNYTTAQKKTYEYGRARKLMPVLRRLDALLDIHSSNHPQSTPFVICEPGSRTIARRLPVGIVSSGWDKTEPGGTDAFVNAAGGRGICVECGPIEKKDNTIGIAKKSILIFLSIMDAIDAPIRFARRKQEFIKVNFLYRTKKNFIPYKMRKDFSPIKKGEILGYDAGAPVRSPQNGVVIFMCKRKKSGEEAFLLGSSSN